MATKQQDKKPSKQNNKKPTNNPKTNSGTKTLAKVAGGKLVPAPTTTPRVTATVAAKPTTTTTTAVAKPPPKPVPKLDKGAKLQNNNATRELKQKIAAKTAAGADTSRLQTNLLRRQTNVGNRRAEAKADAKAAGKGGATMMGAGTGMMALMDAMGAAKTGRKVPELAGARFGEGANKALGGKLRKGKDIWASMPGGKGDGFMTTNRPGGGKGGGKGGGGGGNNGKLVPPPGSGRPVTPPPVTTPPPVVTKPPVTTPPVTTPPASVTARVTQQKPTEQLKPAEPKKTSNVGGGTAGGGTGLGGDAYLAGRAHQGSGEQNKNRKGTSRFRFA